jgi:hypothetical protein
MNGRPESGMFDSLKCFLHERASRLLDGQQGNENSSVARDVYLRTTTPWRRVAR